MQLGGPGDDKKRKKRVKKDVLQKPTRFFGVDGNDVSSVGVTTETTVDVDPDKRTINENTTLLFDGKPETKYSKLYGWDKLNYKQIQNKITTSGWKEE